MKFLFLIVLITLIFCVPSLANGMFENGFCFFGHPKDFYNFLVNEPIDITQKGIKKFKFTHKYDGKYSAGILLEKFSPDELYFTKYDLKLKIKMDFYLQEKLIFSRIENTGSSFIGKKDSGFILLMYQCPKDLPKNHLITCELTIIEPDFELSGKYGSVRFYVQKESDE